jgi:hypothetical protein
LIVSVQEMANVHSSKVTSVSLSPDARTVLTCSRGRLSLSLSLSVSLSLCLSLSPPSLSFLHYFFPALFHPFSSLSFSPNADDTLKQIDIRTYSVVQVTLTLTFSHTLIQSHPYSHSVFLPLSRFFFWSLFLEGRVHLIFESFLHRLFDHLTSELLVIGCDQGTLNISCLSVNHPFFFFLCFFLF